MPTDHARVPDRRSGFTLVEMLVVLSIILTLAVITVLFMPRFGERQKVPRGASLLQGWLMMAKQRAIRDRTATGIRFQPLTQLVVRDLQYIRKPDDYSPGGSYTPDALFKGPVNPADPPAGVQFGPLVNLYGSSAGLPADQFDETSLIQVGDYLQLRSAGLLHRISQIKSAHVCLLDSVPEVPPAPGCPFRIIRQPRPLPGEQALQLPQDVIIDLAASLNVPTRGNFREILFSPSGAVIGQGTGNTPIALLLRDVTQDPNTGDQALIVIYPRTGLIANQPVAVGTDPFLFVRDGRSSGF
jgi:prepilin-type N-terminal cleavage/methylation domain-containing protein